MRKVIFNGKECEGHLVDFEAANEHWSNYKVADGTVIKMKLLVSEIIKVPGEYYENGEPVYLFSHSITSSVSAPIELQRNANIPTDKKKLQ